MVSKKRLLVIGSKGLIGKSFIEEYKKKFEIFECGRKNNLKKILAKTKPNLIFNTSGEPYFEPKMFESNLLLVKRLIEYLRKNSNCYLLHLGSSSEYGRCNFPSKETTSLKPETPYEATKSASSMLLIGYAKSYNLKAIIVRPYCVYGYHSKPNLLIPLILQTILDDSSMKIYRGFHDFIYVKDFVRGIFVLLNNRKKWKPGEIINMGSGKQISNYQVLKEIRKVFGKKRGKFKIINKHFKTFDSDKWVSNSKYIQKKYNFKIKYNFRSSLIDMKKEFLKKTNFIFE